MLIKDTQGKYELEVDVSKRIVVQRTVKGLFPVDAMERMHDDYVKKVIPLFKGQKWAKLCDMRDYATSPAINDLMEQHNKHCVSNGLAHVALVVQSAVAKLQMNRAGDKVKFAPMAFTTMEEAYDYLRTNGYK